MYLLFDFFCGIDMRFRQERKVSTRVTFSRKADLNCGDLRFINLVWRESSRILWIKYQHFHTYLIEDMKIELVIVKTADYYQFTFGTFKLRSSNFCRYFCWQPHVKLHKNSSNPYLE